MTKVKWATPYNSQEPILKLNEKGIKLNSPAIKLLKEVQRVKIGVTDNGEIILKPDSGPRTYTVTLNNKSRKPSSAKIGSTALAEYLNGHGISNGEYVLTFNGFIKVFVAKEIHKEVQEILKDSRRLRDVI